ncbi:hypothetical protein FGB62_140g033 [Gracilaria domingensis]|nr:hypothetical protein FGB62_140g033 [Gracilaria domingensis]
MMHRAASRTAPTIACVCALFLFASVRQACSQDVEPDAVRSVQGVVTDAVESLSQQLLNHENDTNNSSEGRAALEDARAQAQAQAQQMPLGVTDGFNGTEATTNSTDIIGPADVSCEGDCEYLADQLLDAVEGPACRSLFTTGKCPSPCMQAITVITSNSSWPACATMCAGEMVTGAAQRWSTLCEIRQETLVDKGKEAVKNFVADGLGSGFRPSVLLRFSLGVLILFLGVVYGYRRGALSTHIAYRLQKRRLLSRKNSDASLPL